MSTENSILLSIKPYYVEKIFEGSKTIELRRKMPKQIKENSLVVVYSTSPTKSIFGAFKVKGILEATKENLWEKVQLKAAVNNSEFEEYFNGCEVGYGIEIGEKYSFENPISLNKLREVDGSFNVPQSFRYLTDQDLSFVENELSRAFT